MRPMFGSRSSAGWVRSMHSVLRVLQIDYTPYPEEDPAAAAAGGGRRSRVRRSLYEHLGQEAFQVCDGSDGSGDEGKAQGKREPKVRPAYLAARVVASAVLMVMRMTSSNACMQAESDASASMSGAEELMDDVDMHDDGETP